MGKHPHDPKPRPGCIDGRVRRVDDQSRADRDPKLSLAALTESPTLGVGESVEADALVAGKLGR